MKKDLEKIRNEINLLVEDLSNLRNNFFEDYKSLVSRYTKINNDGKIKNQR